MPLIKKMLWFFVFYLGAVLAAEAASDSVEVHGSWFPFLYALGGSLVGGAVQWGAVRNELRRLREDLGEVRISARNAHGRIDQHVDTWHRS